MTSIRQVVRVKPGHLVEIVAPELIEGDLVNVIVVPCGAPSRRPADSVLAFLDSLPAGPRAFGSWDEYETSLREERSSWDR